MPTISYRRISAARLVDLLERQDEDATHAYFNQDYGVFPYTLHHYALDEYWPLLRDFLEINHNPNHIFWPLIHGARPLIAHYPPSDQEYLTVIDYMTPAEVQAISQAMAQITQKESLQRYMRWRKIEDEMAVWEEDPRDYTGYRFVYDLFRDVFCFFHIAEEAGDGMLRQYGG